ncbi:YopX protein [compost metagenome]
MNRQIKFRGQVTDTKKWVFGYYFNHAGIDRIFVPEKGSFTVIPETVGQFTGLTDKNGTEIYEGDKVIASMKYKGVTLMPFRAFIFYNENVACWQIKYETTVNNFATDFIYSYDIEIVGNIHQESEVTNG